MIMETGRTNGRNQSRKWHPGRYCAKSGHYCAFLPCFELQQGQGAQRRKNSATTPRPGHADREKGGRRKAHPNHRIGFGDP
jgi:hypothetical protein